MTDASKLAVVLVNYNNEDDTIACLDTLEDQTLDDVLIIVVDNGSDEGSLSRLRNAFDFPVYIENEENRGFTGGNNTGIEYALDAGADWILLLNNDTELDPEFLEEFLAAANDLPDDIGIVGPKIHTDESSNIWSAGGVIDVWTAETGSLHETDQSIDRPTAVDLVAGAALLVRDAVFSDIGLLDDEFFIYYEETEFCARARHNGWGVMYVPVEGVYHKETTDHSYSAFAEYYLIRNRWLYQQKTQPLHVRLVFYPYYVLRWMMIQTIYLLIVERNAPVARATARGGMDAILNRTGKRHADALKY